MSPEASRRITTAACSVAEQVERAVCAAVQAISPGTEERGAYCWGVGIGGESCTAGKRWECQRQEKRLVKGGKGTGCCASHLSVCLSVCLSVSLSPGLPVLQFFPIALWHEIFMSMTQWRGFRMNSSFSSAWFLWTNALLADECRLLSSLCMYTS